MAGRILARGPCVGHPCSITTDVEGAVPKPVGHCGTSGLETETCVEDRPDNVVVLASREARYVGSSQDMTL